MRPRRSCLAAILLLSTAAPAHAQNERGLGVRDGIQSSVNRIVGHFLEGADELGPQFREVGRHMWLFSNDIVLRMSATDEGERVNLGPGGELLGWREEGGESSLYAEFDWQNRAEYMRVNTSDGKASLGLAYAGEVMSREARDDVAEMYFDKNGYAYVLVEHESGNEFYVRVNVPGMMGDLVGALQISIDNAIEDGVAEALDRVFSLMGALAPDALHRVFGSGSGMDPNSFAEDMQDFVRGMRNFLDAYAPSYNPETGEYEFAEGVTEDRFREFLENVESMERRAREQFEELGAFPPLIHFAFILTPTTVRSQASVQPSTIPCGGQDDCTRFVVTSGEQRGYILVFDHYDRLVYLRDTDGSSATYSYDRDVTVTLPPSVSVGQLMGR